MENRFCCPRALALLQVEGSNETTHTGKCFVGASETHWLDTCDLRTTCGSYPQLFRTAPPTVRQADMTPDYFHTPRLPSLLLSLMPSPSLRDATRLVVSLREPASRMLSWYNQRIWSRGCQGCVGPSCSSQCAHGTISARFCTNATGPGEEASANGVPYPLYSTTRGTLLSLRGESVEGGFEGGEGGGRGGGEGGEGGDEQGKRGPAAGPAGAFSPSFHDETACAFLKLWLYSYASHGWLRPHSATDSHTGVPGQLNLIPSHYVTHLQRWRRAGWRRSQLMVVGFAELVARPAELLPRIRRFAGVHGGGVEADELPRVNEKDFGGLGVSQVERMCCATWCALDAHFAPLNAELYAMMRYDHHAAEAPPEERLLDEFEPPECVPCPPSERQQPIAHLVRGASATDIERCEARLVAAAHDPKYPSASASAIVSPSPTQSPLPPPRPPCASPSATPPPTPPPPPRLSSPPTQRSPPPPPSSPPWAPPPAPAPSSSQRRERARWLASAVPMLLGLCAGTVCLHGLCGELQWRKTRRRSAYSQVRKSEHDACAEHLRS